MIIFSFANAFDSAQRELEEALTTIHKGRVYEALTAEEKEILGKKATKYVQLKLLHAAHIFTLPIALLMGLSVLYFKGFSNLLLTLVVAAVSYGICALPLMALGRMLVWCVKGYYQNTKKQGNLYLFGITQCYQAEITAQAPMIIRPYIEAAPERIEHMRLENRFYTETVAQFDIWKRDSNLCEVNIAVFCIEIKDNDKSIHFYFEPAEEAYQRETLETFIKEPYLNGPFRFPIVKALFEKFKEKGWLSGELGGGY